MLKEVDDDFEGHPSPEEEGSPVVGKMSADEFWAFRDSRGWSQNRLAQELGVNQSQVSRWERGLQPIPGMVKRLVAHLQMLRDGA